MFRAGREAPAGAWGPPPQLLPDPAAAKRSPPPDVFAAVRYTQQTLPARSLPPFPAGPSLPSLSLPRLARPWLLLSLCVLPLLAFVSADHADEKTPPVRVKLKKGDHVAIIGNTTAERLQHDGWLSTYLHSRFPSHDLVFRNLGFSGDEVGGYTA